MAISVLIGRVKMMMSVMMLTPDVTACGAVRGWHWAAGM